MSITAFTQFTESTHKDETGVLTGNTGSQIVKALLVLMLWTCSSTVSHFMIHPTLFSINGNDL